VARKAADLLITGPEFCEITAAVRLMENSGGTIGRA
jgi:hypothetical protein